MPTYEYKCTECEEIFEFFQRITEEPLKTCPVCGGGLNRLISGGMGVIFKGSGFYTTDYKNSSNKSFDTGKKKEDTEISSSKDTKSDTKSESSESADRKIKTTKK